MMATVDAAGTGEPRQVDGRGSRGGRARGTRSRSFRSACRFWPAPDRSAPVIVFAHEARGWGQWGDAGRSGSSVNSALTYIFLALSTRLYQWLGQTGVNVVSRLMGMIPVAMAGAVHGRRVTGLFPHSPERVSGDLTAARLCTLPPAR